MTLFVLSCIDRPGSLERRMAAREAHLAYLAGHADRVRLAGPFLGADGQPVGSMLVIDAADLAAAQAFADADPYRLADLFQSVDIRAWRITIGEIA
jgi:uncharacterized protein YciI